MHLFEEHISYVSYRNIVCACVYSKFLSMSNLSHAYPSIYPYLVKYLLILHISFGTYLFSAFIFPVWRGLLFFKLLLLLQQTLYSQYTPNTSMTFPWIFFGYISFLSCIKQTENSQCSGRSWTTVWTGSRMLSMLCFQFPCSVFCGLFWWQQTLHSPTPKLWPLWTPFSLHYKEATGRLLGCAVTNWNNLFHENKSSITASVKSPPGTLISFWQLWPTGCTYRIKWKESQN